MSKYSIKEVTEEGEETELARVGDLDIAKSTLSIFHNEYTDQPDQYNVSSLNITDETGELVYRKEIK